MKNKIIAIALCVVMCAGALALTSCTANTAGNADDTTATTTTETKATETQSSIIDEAETMIDDVTDGIKNGMGDPRFSDHQHRGMTPFGK